MHKAIYILGDWAFPLIYGLEEQEAISSIVEIVSPHQTRESICRHMDYLNDVEIVFSGWDGPKIDTEFLRSAPNLKLVLYGAGSVRSIVSEAFWDRNVRISSAFEMNAIPVSEYTLAMIILGLKRAFALNRAVLNRHHYVPLYLDQSESVPGAYGSTVGLVSLGMIGNMVCRRLQSLSVRVVAHDPYVSEAQVQELGVDRLVSLNELFSRCDVVTIHTPLLPETRHMIRGEHVKAMKQGAVLINSSRGGVVHQDELISVLKERPDLQAVLDVTDPEPPPHDSPLYELPNVFLTPHIAGSVGGECARMGRAMYEECLRFTRGEPLKWEIAREQFQIMA